MRRKLNLAKGFCFGKIEVKSMITSKERKQNMMPERYAAEKSRRKRHLVEFELDEITAKKTKTGRGNLFLYFLKRDNAKRKPYTGNRFVRFDEKGEVEIPLLYSTIRVHLRLNFSYVGYNSVYPHIQTPSHSFPQDPRHRRTSIIQDLPEASY